MSPNAVNLVSGPYTTTGERVRVRGCFSATDIDLQASLHRLTLGSKACRRTDPLTRPLPRCLFRPETRVTVFGDMGDTFGDATQLHYSNSCCCCFACGQLVDN